MFVPYLEIAWLKENFPEPVPFGVSHGMSSDEITHRLGGAPYRPWPAQFRCWRKVLDPARDVIFDVTDHGQISVRIAHARELASPRHPAKPLAGLFLAWAAGRGLIDVARFAAHADLLAAVRRRENKGSDLLTAAIPRGIWDIHLKDTPGLRDFAYGWFHNIEHGYIVSDLIAVFGVRQGKHGHKEPVLDNDDWNAVDRAAPALDARFAAFV